MLARGTISKLGDWIDSVHNKGLAALLRGVLAVDKEETQITFVWCSSWHRDEGSRREPEIRQHLSKFGTIPIVHKSVYDVAKDDPMLDEALKLGARVKFLEETPSEAQNLVEKGDHRCATWRTTNR